VGPRDVHLLEGPWSLWIGVQKCKKCRETVYEDVTELHEHVKLYRAPRRRDSAGNKNRDFLEASE
jgi:hypothetical protein